MNRGNESPSSLINVLCCLIIKSELLITSLNRELEHAHGYQLTLTKEKSPKQGILTVCCINTAISNQPLNYFTTTDLIWRYRQSKRNIKANQRIIFPDGISSWPPHRPPWLLLHQGQMKNVAFPRDISLLNLFLFSPLLIAHEELSFTTVNSG